MDPLGAITSLLGVVNYLRTASDKIKQNREECHRLANHGEAILRLIEVEVKNGAPVDVTQRLTKVKSTLAGLNSTLDELSGQSRLKKLLWRDDIGVKVSETYRDLAEAALLFDLGSKVDIRRFQYEHEIARRADAAEVRENFMLAQRNDHEIIKHLEIQKSQMQEAVAALRKVLPAKTTCRYGRKILSGERNACDGTMHWGLNAVPDVFEITSLDIIIRHDKKIGEGGCGEVFIADWQGNTVAVKVFKLDRSAHSDIFQREIDVWKRLRHPNVLEFFGACSIANPPFSVCALKLRGDAMRYLHHNPSANRCQLVYEASLGLGYLHRNSVIHGDLKASNILIDDNGTACLCDFGLAKIRTHTTTVHVRSDSPSTKGTLRWMSPEQISLGITNKPSDIYSFGMTIYEVFSGAAPFAGTTDNAIYPSVVDRGLRPPRPDGDEFVRRGLDEALWTLIRECWSQEPSSRPTSWLVTSRLASSQLKVHAPALNKELPQRPVEDHPSSEPGVSRSRGEHPSSIHSAGRRRINKDMISNPSGFVHLIHASHVDQAEAILTRWDSDGMGKLGDPRWANAIRQRTQDKSRKSPDESRFTAPSPVDGLPKHTNTLSFILDRRPSSHDPHSHGDHMSSQNTQTSTVVAARKLITPSMATLEKAASVRIYFENLYFPLFHHPAAREQRRLAMETAMTSLGLDDRQKEDHRSYWRRNESEYLRQKRQKIHVSSFIRLKKIGHGSFGVVSLVKEKSTGELYAMKELRKTDMLLKGKEGHVRAEQDLLKSSSLVNSDSGAEWIVRLQYSFQDRNNLYMILEYMGGGDLLNLLIERDTLDENFTCFYIAEMILAIESCHRHGFIHRDIKPDNFLFDQHGHIKLSDFGLASVSTDYISTDLHWAHENSYYEQQRSHILHKHGIDLEDSNGIADGKTIKRLDQTDAEGLFGDDNERTGIFSWREKHRRQLAYSVCGNYSYMAPEVIRAQGYSYPCDWWSLGIVMFECLYGFPPFVSHSRHVTRMKILNWSKTLRFPSRPSVSFEGVDLMKQLLCEPEDRLGSGSLQSANPALPRHTAARGFAASKGGSADGSELIKAHPFFYSIDWENIHRLPAPFHPELHDPEDTRYFSPDIRAESLASATASPIQSPSDPMLIDKVNGEEILGIRKALAFAHHSPRLVKYERADKETNSSELERGRSTPRTTHRAGKGRSLSI